jgi:MFS family permease
MPASDAALRQHPAFVLFWLARVASTIAFQMQAVAVAWLVYDLTGSAFALGMVGLAQFVPALLLALVVGHVADRYDRPRIVRACQAAQCLTVAALALGALTGGLTLPAIFAAIVTLGATRAFEMPTMQALLPNLVPPGLLPRAVAGSASANQTAVIVGPAIGGFLYAGGATVVFVASATLFLIAALLIAQVRPMTKQQASKEPASFRTLFGGISFIAGRPAVLGAISLDLFAVLLGGVVALLPIYARDILQIGPSGLGMLRSAPAVGALTMSILLARFPLQHRVGWIMFGGVAMYGLATIVFAVSSWFPLSLAALAVLGASDMVSVVIRVSLIQLETPDDMRGRVSAVNSVFIGGSNQLGDFRAGVTAEAFGAVAAALMGGIGTLIVVGLWMRLFPVLVRVDRLGQR